MKKVRSNKGFTLVELIIVIAILAIIMLIAIPNFSGIQQRMKVRADKATAAQIGKAIRVWYTDYTSDPTLTAGGTADTTFKAGGKCVDYTQLTGISGYTATTYKPTSLLVGANGAPEAAQFYLAGLSTGTTAGKVCVAIANASADFSIPTPDAPVVAYTGIAGAIAYVEP